MSAARTGNRKAVTLQHRSATRPRSPFEAASAAVLAACLDRERGVLREQRAAGLFIELGLEREPVFQRQRADSRRARRDLIDQTLDVRIVGKPLLAEDIASKI